MSWSNKITSNILLSKVHSRSEKSFKWFVEQKKKRLEIMVILLRFHVLTDNF